MALIGAGIGLFKFLKSANWDSINGVVLESKIEKVYQTTLQQGAMGDRTVDYRINIKYRYNVGGQEYTGTKVTAGMPNVAGSKKDGEDIIKKYPEGAKAIIYYNPKFPANSALITGKSVPIWGFIVIGVIILAAGGIIFGFLYAIKRFG